MSGGGRPAGPSPATLEEGRFFASLVDDYSVPVSQIAASRGIRPAQVYEKISIFRKFGANGARLAAVQPALDDDNVPAPAARAPRKLGRAMVARRALDAKRNTRAIQQLPSHQRELWLDTVMDIHQDGDGGVELSMGAPGDLYESRASYLMGTGCVESDLDVLIGRGLLIALPQGGIAMPLRFGLRPAEKAAPRASRDRFDRRQPFMLHSLDGGLSGSRETGVFPETESENTGVFPDSLSAETPIDVSGKTIVFPDNPDDARAAAAAAKNLESLNLSSSSSNPGRARDSGKTPVYPDSLFRENSGFSGKTPAALSGKTPGADSEDIPISDAQPEPAEHGDALGAELAVLTRLSRPLNGEDRRCIRSWLDAGYVEETIRAAITDRMTRAKHYWKAGSIKYFDDVVREWAVRVAELGQKPDAPTQAAPAAPLSAEAEAEQALRKRLARAVEMRGRWSSVPLAPPWDRFKDAGAAGIEWLAEMEAFEAGGYRGDKPLAFDAYVASRRAVH